MHDLIAKMPAEIHGSTQVNPASAEQAAQRLLDFGKPEEANSLLGPKFDEDIDVAGSREPSGDHGTEQGEFSNAVAPAKLANLGLRNLDLRHCHPSPIMAQIPLATGVSRRRGSRNPRAGRLPDQHKNQNGGDHRYQAGADQHRLE